MIILRPTITKLGLKIIGNAINSLQGTGKPIKFTRLGVGDAGYDPTGLEIQMQNSINQASVSINRTGINVYHITSTVRNLGTTYVAKEVGLYAVDENGNDALFAIFSTFNGLLPIVTETPTLLAFDLNFVSAKEIPVEITINGENTGVTFAAELAKVCGELITATTNIISANGEIFALKSQILGMDKRLKELENARFGGGN